MMKRGFTRTLLGLGVVVVVGAGCPGDPGDETKTGGGGGDPTPFTLASTVPADGNDAHDRDARLELHFNAAADLGTVTNAVRLLDGEGDELPVSVSMAQGGEVALLVPQRRLDRGASYRLEVDAGIHPQGGGDALEASSASFTTSSARRARPAISLVGNTDCAGGAVGLPWVELLDDGSAYVALPRRSIQGNCTQRIEPELVSVLSEERAAGEPFVPLTAGVQVGETALHPRRDPGTGNILFLATELSSGQSLYATTVVDNATRQIGAKQTLTDIDAERPSSNWPAMQGYTLPYQGKFHIFYRDGSGSCGGQSCDYVRETVISPSGDIESSSIAFGAAWPFGNHHVWTAASTPGHIVIAFDQYLDSNGRYFMLRGPDYTDTFDPDWPIWGKQRAYTHIDPAMDLGILLYVIEGAGPFRVFTVKLSTGEVTISPTNFFTGAEERILPSSARRAVATLLDTARETLWILWSEAEHDTATASAGGPPYRLRLTAFDYATLTWSETWTIQEGFEPYESGSGARNETENTALLMDGDGALLLIHTDLAGDAGGGLVLQRFDPEEGSVEPLARLFTRCAGPEVVDFDAARNEAGDLAVAIQAKYAQQNCESEGEHEDGEFVLVRYD